MTMKIPLLPAPTSPPRPPTAVLIHRALAVARWDHAEVSVLALLADGPRPLSSRTLAAETGLSEHTARCSLTNLTARRILLAGPRRGSIAAVVAINREPSAWQGVRWNRPARAALRYVQDGPEAQA